MESPVFPEPGTQLPPGPASLDALQRLARRRSCLAQQLSAPGPSPDQIDVLLRLAARVPDHGALAPWRLILLEGHAKTGFIDRLEGLAQQQENPTKALAALVKLRVPPTTLVVVFRPREGNIPVWEQQLSTGALCMNLLVAAQAMGLGASWITGWYAYSDPINQLLGLGADERIAGYIHLGTPQEAPRERPRPDINALISRWSPARHGAATDIP